MDKDGDISTSGKNQLKNSNSLIPSVSMPEEKPPFSVFQSVTNVWGRRGES